MDDLKKIFTDITKIVEKKVDTYSDNQKLDFYKFYKQATIGDNDTKKPMFINFKAKSKWNAWNSVKGLSSEDAMKKYIRLSEIL